MNIRRNYIYAAITILSISLFSHSYPVNSQTINEQTRIDRLERDIKTLSRAVYSGSTSPTSTINTSQQANSHESAGHEIRISQMEIELRSLTGKIEQQEFLIRRIQEKIDKVIGDMEIRIGELESQINNSNNNNNNNNTRYDQKSDQTQTNQNINTLQKIEIINSDDAFSPNNDISKTGIMRISPIRLQPETEIQQASATSADVYDYAFGLLKKREYDDAEKEFKSFIKDFPNDKLIANAKYWLGETYYVRAQYETAARIFAEGFKLYPQHQKAPDNLLKLGLSFAGMDNKKNACTTLKEITKKYKHGHDAILNRTNREIKNIGCNN